LGPAGCLVHYYSDWRCRADTWRSGIDPKTSH
jgi:hypothetical protein